MANEIDLAATVDQWSKSLTASKTPDNTIHIFFAPVDWDRRVLQMANDELRRRHPDLSVMVCPAQKFEIKMAVRTRLVP